MGPGKVTVRGKPRLREYWGMALARYPELRFTLFRAYAGPRSLVLHYQSIQGAGRRGVPRARRERPHPPRAGPLCPWSRSRRRLSWSSRDLAGTTVYDRGEVPAAFADALREAAVPFDPAEITAWRGASKREVLGRLLGGTARRRTRWPSACHGSMADSTRCWPSGSRARRRSRSLGVGEAFARLRAGGIGIALTTGFDRGLVEQLLAAVDWADLVDAWVCSDDVLLGRPAPDMIVLAMRRCGVTDAGRIAVVGDTRLDLEAARNAGARWRIGVLTGAHDRATLAAAPHTHLLDSVRDLPSLWLRD